ncbi:PTS fructose transporter subunit IIA [Variovorax sp. PCZ-1]|uniref:PTS sugar transporter subunit IIA n=1 Tax=Variovorax sp. PCZ-1 TaxID=2835533 RepID=UPI001BCE6782|nr:PTS fructose transporter subunit IIA [Variovorax sp. PCZ-1]
MNHILIIAHAPLASALKACALHVFPDCNPHVSAMDVPPNMPPQESVAQARVLLAQQGSDALLLTDVFGATPSNIAKQLTDGIRTRLLTGVNLPMLLRAVTYRHESLDVLVQRALAGGSQGVMQVAVTAPQNQTLKNHDSNDHQSQQ